MPFAGWSPIGIAALVLIIAGIALLGAYAVQRGLLGRELEGIEASPEPGSEAPAVPGPTAPVPGAHRPRRLGAIGAGLLAVGLALGAISAVDRWGTDGAATGPGAAPVDCAQAWSGCPKATPNP